MSENPRQPDRNSEVPSARPSSAPNQGNPNHDSGYNPPPPPPNYVPPTKTHVRNLLIGAVITIITSTVVFYLTQVVFKKPDSNDFQRRKEATIDAWDSYVAYENIYTKNTFILDSTDTDIEKLLADAKIESGKFQKDVADLTTRKDVDKDLIRVLNRRLENEKNNFPLFEQYANHIAAIIKSNKPLKTRLDEQAAALSEWLKTYRGLYERAINDIKEIARVLSDRYPHQFDMNSFDVVTQTPGRLLQLDSLLIIMKNTTYDSSGYVIVGIDFARNVKPSSITGKWVTTNSMNVDIDPDGKMIWTVSNGGEADGSWKLENDKLKMQAVIKPQNKKVVWIFKLAYIRANSFTLANANAPYEIYKMTRRPAD